MDLEQRLDMSLADLLKATKKSGGGSQRNEDSGSGANRAGGKEQVGRKSRKSKQSKSGANKKAAGLGVHAGGVKKTSAGTGQVQQSGSGKRKKKGVAVGGGKKVAVRPTGRGAPARQAIMPSKPLPKGRKGGAGVQQAQLGGTRGNAPKVTGAGAAKQQGDVIHLRLRTAKEAQQTLEAIQRAAIQARNVLRQKGVLPKRGAGPAAGNILPTRHGKRGGKHMSATPAFEGGQPQTQIIREIHYVPAGGDHYAERAPQPQPQHVRPVPVHAQPPAASRYMVDPSIANQPPPPDPARRFLDDRNDDDEHHRRRGAVAHQHLQEHAPVPQRHYATQALRAVKGEPEHAYSRRSGR